MQPVLLWPHPLQLHVLPLLLLTVQLTNLRQCYLRRLPSWVWHRLVLRRCQPLLCMRTHMSQLYQERLPRDHAIGLWAFTERCSLLCPQSPCPYHHGHRPQHQVQRNQLQIKNRPSLFLHVAQSQILLPPTEKLMERLRSQSQSHGHCWLCLWNSALIYHGHLHLVLYHWNLVLKQVNRIILCTPWILCHPLATLLVQWKDLLESQTKICLILFIHFVFHLLSFLTQFKFHIIFFIPYPYKYI